MSWVVLRWNYNLPCLVIGVSLCQNYTPSLSVTAFPLSPLPLSHREFKYINPNIIRLLVTGLKTVLLTVQKC